MPNFRYQAVDSRGQVHTGTMQANDARAVQNALRQRGLMIQQVVRIPDTPAPSPTPAPSATPDWESSAVPPAKMAHLLVQLHALVKAGYPLSESFRQVADRIAHKELAQVCREIAQKATQGIPVSQAMQHYPRLFPAFVYHALYAGELGGYLPEALERLVQYYERWRSIQLWSMPTKGCLWITVILLPVVAPFGFGLLNALSRIKGTETPVEALGVIFQSWWAEIVRIGVPLWVGMLGAWALWALGMRSEAIRGRFHLFVPLVWGFADWVRAQSLQIFLYHLTRLSAAGLPPATVWETAARTVPNPAIAGSLASVSLARGERAEHLDSALARSGMFPPDEVALVTTGIQAGQVVEMLQRLADYYQERSQNAFRMVPSGLIRLAILIGLLGVGIALVLIYWGWYGQLTRLVNEWLGTP